MNPSADSTALSFTALRFWDAPAIFRNAPTWRWTTTIPDYYNFWYAMRGQGVLRVDGREYPFKAGTCFVLAPGQQVDGEHDQRDSFWNFAAHLHTLGRQGRRVAAREFPLMAVAVRDTALFDVAVRHVVRQHGAAEPGRRVAERWLLAMVNQVVADARLPAIDPVDERILAIAERIAANPGAWASVADMARDAGLSRVHFTRRFTRATGENPSRYLIRRRVERATHFIQQSTLKLADIAEMLGYSDVYFFSRQFKAVAGFSPSQLRRRSPR